MDSFKVLSYNSSVCDLASYLGFQTADAFGGLIPGSVNLGCPNAGTWPEYNRIYVSRIVKQCDFCSFGTKRMIWLRRYHTRHPAAAAAPWF